MRHILVLCVLSLVTLASLTAEASVRRVPADYPTIQAAVDAASDGDKIVVSGGRHCGATLTKEVHLIGGWNARIVGCGAPAPALGLLRIGFFLPDERASGTSIHGFSFDGAGVSDDNVEPLAFGVFARDAHGVKVVGTRMYGTVQGISNGNGDGWLVAANWISELTLFSCPGFCGGGTGIVIQRRVGDDELGWGNAVIGNHVSGRAPDGHDDFDIVGVFVLAQERPLVAGNLLAIKHNPAAAALAIGVHVANTCCGLPDPFPFTEHAILVGNDGRRSDFVIVVDPGNAGGAIIHGNRGVSMIEGETCAMH